MTNTLLHIWNSQDGAEHWPTAGDYAPADTNTPSGEQLRDLALQKLRADSLHERLAERGLAREAEVLSIRQLDASKLDALEAVVARLESGVMPDLLAALRTNAGTAATLNLLKRVQDPDSAAAFGERFALAVICKADDEGHDFHVASDDGYKIREVVEGAAEELRNRLELVEEGLRRLDAAGIRGQGSLGPMQ